MTVQSRLLTLNPKDLYFPIFSYLSREEQEDVARTCRTFANFLGIRTLKEDVFRTVGQVQPGPDICANQARIIKESVEGGGTARGVDLERYKLLTTKELTSEKLKDLDLSDSVGTLPKHYAPAEEARREMNLCIKNNNIQELPFYNVTRLRAVLESLPALESLSLAGWEKYDGRRETNLVTTEVLQLVAECCPNLKRLNLQGCSIGDKELQAIASLTNLEVLKIDGKNITSIGYAVISNHFEHLIELEMDQCRHLQFADLQKIIQKAQNLEVIKLPFTTLTDEGLNEIGLWCKKLTTLSFGSIRISEIGIKALGAGCPHLTKLTLWRSGWGAGRRLKPKVISTNSQLKAIAANLTGLRFLALDDCSAIRDSGISQVITSCTRLQHLSLSSDQITDEGLKGISGLQELQFLELRNSKITDETIKLLSGCPKLHTLILDRCRLIKGLGFTWRSLLLKRLSLSGAKDFTDEGLKNIGNNYPSLLTACFQSGEKPSFTDEGVKALIAGCHVLRGLTLWNNKKLTNRVLDAIKKKNLTTLRSLNLDGSTGIKTEAMQDLVNHFPQLRVFQYPGWITAKRTTPPKPSMIGYVLGHPATKVATIAALGAIKGPWAAAAGLGLWGGYHLTKRMISWCRDS